MIRTLTACLTVLLIGGCSGSPTPLGSLEIPGQVGSPVVGTYAPTSFPMPSPVADHGPEPKRRPRPAQTVSPEERKVQAEAANADCRHAGLGGSSEQLSYSSFSAAGSARPCPD